MKKIILTLLIFTLPSFLIAKKNSQLVFSRVATFIPAYNFSTNTSPYYKPDSGKVWKIENIRPDALGLANIGWTLEVNGFPLRTYLSGEDSHVPIWLSDSDSIRFKNYLKSNVLLVSMLEFEVVD